MTVNIAGVVLTASVAAFFVGALGSFVDRRIGYLASSAGSAGLLAVAVTVLVGGSVTGATWSGPLGGGEGLSLDALSAFFVLVASIVWIATSLYSFAYDDRRAPLLAVTYSLTLGSIALLMSASDQVLFLLGWETMTLASYGMILQARGRGERVYSAAFVFLAFGEASTLFVFLAVAGIWVGTGTFTFGPHLGPGSLATLVFVAGLIGFGLKMGIVPFHMSEWLPIAHSSAPSNASAVLSATLTLAGAYGLFRIVSLLSSPPLWWGAVMLGIGAISALLGALFASVSEHTKGLPAYSTIENNGLILVALGVALLAESDGLTALAIFAVFAALYQAMAHSVAKTGLFLSAGYVEHTAHTFDLNSVEGSVKEGSPGEYVGTLAAVLSLAAGPPLAGFVSEWMILESLFQSYRFGQSWAQFVGLLSGAAVALAAGLILVAMVKFAGFSVLWKPHASSPAKRTPGLGAVVAAVGVIVLAIGVLAPWVLRFLTPSASALLGTNVSAPVGSLLSVPPGWSILSGSPFGILSPPMIPIALLVGATVGAGYYVLGRPRPRRRVKLWMAGSPPGEPGETYTSFAYSTGIRVMMSSVLGTREVRESQGPVVVAGVHAVEPYSVDLEVFDSFKLFYTALVRIGNEISDALKAWIMPGHLGRYLAYVLVVVLAVVIYVAAAY